METLSDNIWTVQIIGGIIAGTVSGIFLILLKPAVETYLTPLLNTYLGSAPWKSVTLNISMLLIGTVGPLYIYFFFTCLSIYPTDEFLGFVYPMYPFVSNRILQGIIGLTAFILTIPSSGVSLFFFAALLILPFQLRSHYLYKILLLLIAVAYLWFVYRATIESASRPTNTIMAILLVVIWAVSLESSDSDEAVESAPTNESGDSLAATSLATRRKRRRK